MLTRGMIALAFFVPSVALAQMAAHHAPPASARMALSDTELAELRQGMGMGLAKPAEINGYPGPSHALDIAAQLELSAEQVAALGAIRERMATRARALGAEIIAQEEVLARLFAEGRVDGEKLATATAENAALRGRLRAVHLGAHLETKALLSAQQVRRYAVLRGYAAAPGDAPIGDALTSAPPHTSGGSGIHRPENLDRR